MEHISIKESNNKSLYAQPEIGDYVNEIRNKAMNQLVSELIIATEANDTLLFLNILDKFSNLQFSLFSNNQLELLLNACLKMLIENQTNCKVIFNIIVFLTRIIGIKRIDKLFNINFDWKLFYKIYFITESKSFEFIIEKTEMNMSQLHNFFLKMSKYFHGMTMEDYTFIKNEALEHLYHNRFYNGLNTLLYFAPKRFLEEDKELQEIVFKLMKRKYSLMDKICEIFRLILSKKGTLKIDIEDFIKSYFNFLSRYITGITGVNIRQASENKDKNKLESYIELICFELLIQDKFIQYRELIDHHFKLLIPDIHLKFKEKYVDTSTSQSIEFMVNFSKSIRYYLYDKVLKNEENQYHIYVAKSNNRQLIKRYNVIISYLYPVIQKLFLFDMKKANMILKKLYAPLCNESFEMEIIKMLKFFYENFEICSFKLVVKFQCVLFNILQKQNFKGEIASFTFEIIDFMIEHICSNNPSLSNNILKCLADIYNYCGSIKDDIETKKHPSLIQLLDVMTKKSVTIIKRIIPIISILSSKMHQFKWFYSSMLSFLPKPKQEELSREFCSYIIENEIEERYFESYFTGVTNTKQLWTFCYENLISIEESNENEAIDKPQWFLYDIEKDLGNKRIEIMIHNEKRLAYYKEVLMKIDFNDFELNDKIKRQFKYMIYGFLIQKDKKNYDLAFTVFNAMIESLLNAYSFAGKIIYPNERQLTYSNELITTLIMPYQKYITDLIDTPFDNRKQINEWESLSKLLIEKDFEKITYVYLHYQTVFMKMFNNLFIIDNNELPSSNNVNPYDLFKSTIDHYTIINKQLSHFKAINQRLIKINKYTKVLSNLNTLDLLYQNIAKHINCENSENEQQELKMVLNNAKNYSTMPSLYSHYKRWQNKLTGLNHPILFRTFLSKHDIITNINMLLYAFDYCQPFNKNTSITFPIDTDMQSLELMIYKVIGKYIKILGTMNDDLVADRSKMDFIYENSMYLIKLLFSIQPYGHINTTNQFIRIINILLAKNYQKTKIICYAIFSILKLLKDTIVSPSTLISIKLTSYPQINQLAISHKDNDKYSTFIGGLNDKIIHQQRLTEQNKVNYEQDLMNYINEFYNQFDLNTLSQNISVAMILCMTNGLILLKCFDKNHEKYLPLLLKFEKTLLDKIISNDQSFIMKKFYLDLYTILLKHKVKAYKTYGVTSYTKEDYGKNKDSIVKSSKGHEFSDAPISYSALSSYTIPSSSSQSLGIIKALWTVIYQIKDWSNDQTLMKTFMSNPLFSSMNLLGGALSDNFPQAFFHSQNHSRNNRFFCFTFNQSMQKTEATMFYHFLLNYPTAFSYDTVFDHFASSIDTKDSVRTSTDDDSISSLACLLEILVGLIRHDIKNHKYANVKAALVRVFDYHTNGINKQIDSLIFHFLDLIITKCKMNDIEEILPFDHSNLNHYPLELQIDVMILIGSVFVYNSHYLFDNNDILKTSLNNIINVYQSDQIKRIGYQGKFNAFLEVYFFGLKYYLNNSIEFTYDHSPDAMPRLLSLLSFTKDNDSYINDDVLKMINNISIYSMDHIVSHKDDLLTYLQPYITQGAKEENISSVLKHLNSLFVLSRDPLIITTIMKDFNRYINQIQGQKSKLILLVLIKKIFQLNIHFNISQMDLVDFFSQLLLTLENINDELKDSFSEMLVSYYEIIDEEENKKIVQLFRNVIFGEKCDRNAYVELVDNNRISKETIAYMGLAQLLRFRIDIPEYIQELIVDLRKYSNKVNNKGNEAKIIKSIVVKAMDRYHNGYIYLQTKITDQCSNALNELSKATSYFI